jgi:hypothetical protein
MWHCGAADIVLEATPPQGAANDNTESEFAQLENRRRNSRKFRRPKSEFV